MATQINNQTRYSLGAMILHWLIAIAVIVNWRLAEAAEHASEKEGQAIMGTHMALGITILILTVLRLLWRFVHPTPPLASTLKPWEVILARTVHTLFYVLLLLLPLLGWVAMSVYGAAVSMFGLFDWPAFPLPHNKDTAEAIFEVHAVLGTAMLVLIGLHILGALKHTFVDRDGNLFRMLPFGRARP